MNHYTQLSTMEREKIARLLWEGKSLRCIARETGRAASTIFREVRRNKTESGEYSIVSAESCCQERRKKSKRHKRLDDAELRDIVTRFLVKWQWSPEQIEKRLKHEGGKYQISFATIYRAIHLGELDQGLKRKAVRYLRHRGKKRHRKEESEKRGKFPISHTIAERPKEADERAVPGHWEGDTVLGKQGGACVITLVDRCTRMVLLGKSEAKQAEPVKEKTIAMLSPLCKEYVRSITFDRGKEFAQHAKITAALDEMPIYFCDPYSPWQRGSNENMNGLLRQYLPKSFDIGRCSEKRLQQIMIKLNARPRKCLGWRTPLEAFTSSVLHFF